MMPAKEWTRKFVTKDNALHIDPNSKSGAWEWWYFDADFDNGYSVAGTYNCGSPRPPANSEVRYIENSIYDPQGHKRLVRKRYPKEQCHFSPETCNVAIGPNFVRGEHPVYRFYMSEGDQGFDLTYEGQVEGYVQPLDGPPMDPAVPETIFGPGAIPKWTLPMSRAKVTGTLTRDGKTMDVVGEGYHDHNWEDFPLGHGTMVGETMWGWLHVGEWTFNLTGGRTLRRDGDKGTGRILCYKGQKLVAISYKGGGMGLNYTTEGTVNGLMRPRNIRITYNEPGLVEGHIDLTVTQLLECWDLHARYRPFQKWYAETFFGRPAYFRYRFDYDADITVLGERVTGKGRARMEHHRP